MAKRKAMKPKRKTKKKKKESTNGLNPLVKQLDQYFTQLVALVPHHVYTTPVSQAQVKVESKKKKSGRHVKDAENTRKVNMKRKRKAEMALAAKEKDKADGGGEGEGEGDGENGAESQGAEGDLKQQLRQKIAKLQRFRTGAGEDGKVKDKSKRNKNKKQETGRRAEKRVKTKSNEAFEAASDQGDRTVSKQAEKSHVSFGNLSHLDSLGGTLSGTSLTALSQDSKATKKGSNRNVQHLKKRLKHATSEKQRIEELKLSTDVKEQSIGLQKDWQALGQKASGEFDRSSDVKYLKKQIKRVEKTKERKQKLWKARKKTEENLVKEKADRRTANLDRRKQQKVAKRLKKKGIYTDVAAQTNQAGSGSGADKSGPAKQEKRKRMWKQLQETKYESKAEE